jgi:hypothetical protein
MRQGFPKGRPQWKSSHHTAVERTPIFVLLALFPAKQRAAGNRSKDGRLPIMTKEGIPMRKLLLGLFLAAIALTATASGCRHSAPSAGCNCGH